MLARQIKDLSIAYEALSRVPDTYSQASAIRILLDILLAQLKEDSTPKPKPKQAIDLNDDIPF